MLVSYPFTADLGRSFFFFFPGMGTSYLKGFQTFFFFASYLTTLFQGKKGTKAIKQNTTLSLHQKMHKECYCLLKLIPIHFFLINGRVCFGSAYRKQTQLLEKSIMLNRKKYRGSDGAVWWEDVCACNVVHSFMHLQ